MKFLFILVATTIPILSWAGVKDGGGGNEVVSAFRLRASQLISAISRDSRANNLCDYHILRNTFEKAEVEAVVELKDPATNVSIADQKLDAFTVPGKIQLIETAWRSMLLTPSSGGLQVDELIIHELYRATGQCSDDKQELSGKVVDFLSHQPVFSKNYLMRGMVFHDVLDLSFQDTHTVDRYRICESDVDTQDPKPAGMCIVFYRDFWGVPYASLQTGTVDKGSWFSKSQPSLSEALVSGAISESVYNSAINLSKFVSADQPLYVTYELQLNRLYFGVDPNNLIGVQL